MKVFAYCVLIIGLLTVVSGCDLQKKDNPLDDELYTLAERAGAGNLEAGSPPGKDKVELGRMLFFDKILSGNMDISCATCHHPTLNTGDALSLSIGVGGRGLGTDREMGTHRERVPRNATEVYNKGMSEWHTMFWDSRVSGTAETGFISPAGDVLPSGLESILAVQAMFPVTSRDEMRGIEGDMNDNGNRNELALIENKNFPAMWDALMKRLLGIPEYVNLFKAAYPELSKKELGFEHAANAIAAFEGQAFTLTNSPWDRYLRGDNLALSDIAKKGALLFYGIAQCSSCHSGKLMTDQEHHNICIPQLGPGKGADAPLDLGRFGVTEDNADRFAFRTPPLRNVELTGPWMHNGAYTNLEQALRHHLNPMRAIHRYNVEQLEDDLRPTVQTGGDLQKEILNSLDPMMIAPVELTDKEVKDLMAFLYSLTDPEAHDLSKYVPKSVPSGLQVSD